MARRALPASQELSLPERPLPCADVLVAMSQLRREALELVALGHAADAAELEVLKLHALRREAGLRPLPTSKPAMSSGQAAHVAQQQQQHHQQQQQQQQAQPPPPPPATQSQQQFAQQQQQLAIQQQQQQQQQALQLRQQQQAQIQQHLRQQQQLQLQQAQLQAMQQAQAHTVDPRILPLAGQPSPAVHQQQSAGTAAGTRVPAAAVGGLGAPGPGAMDGRAVSVQTQQLQRRPIEPLSSVMTPGGVAALTPMVVAAQALPAQSLGESQPAASSMPASQGAHALAGSKRRAGELDATPQGSAAEAVAQKPN